MPQFVMDKGTNSKEFDALDEFTQGYVEAIFFTECHADNPEMENCDFDDLAPETLKQIVDDCTEFQKENEIFLAQACDDYDMRRAGTDFWFTRNRHGAGFWDRDLGEPGRLLTDAAHAAGSLDLYLGDDERLYL